MGDGPNQPAATRRFDEDAPTQVDELAPPVPRASAAPPPSIAAEITRSESTPGSSSSSLVTARETLGFQEIQRTRVFMRLSLAIAVGMSAALPFVGGDPMAKGVFALALVVVVVVCGRLLLLLRDDAAYTVPRAIAAAYATIFAVFAGIYFYGVFSPGAAIVPLGIYFFCTGQSDRASLAVFITCTTLYGAMGGLVMSGLVADRGLVRADDVPLLERAVILALVEGIFFAVYVIAKKTREATLFAIERHDVVVKGLAQRDALLLEARHDLVHAMRVGGVGRYSGEIVGSFRLGGLIGRGAMGEVYEGVRLDTNEEAALKLVHPQLLADREIIERFLREAKITSALSSQNVVRVIDASAPDAPIPYLAMERLRGEDLATFLRDKKRMGMRRLLTMLRQIGAGLDAAHGAGVVHRDLKPRNLFCARRPKGDEVWKILDFGVSKLDSGDGTLTRGQLIGTPAYMAPEQARALHVGPRADIFALGVIAYRALTGSPPFWGDTNVEILFRVSHGMPVRPGDLAKLPPEVDMVLAIALAKDPGERFATAADFAKALDAASRGRIDDALETRAARLLSRLPWGAPGGPQG
ncbi:MAG: serine/threonine protein kinase [Labilithrix sp.]|nr:serine/threonine protein kinase [Labilithrix sp.]